MCNHWEKHEYIINVGQYIVVLNKSLNYNKFCTYATKSIFIIFTLSLSEIDVSTYHFLLQSIGNWNDLFPWNGNQKSSLAMVVREKEKYFAEKNLFAHLKWVCKIVKVQLWIKFNFMINRIYLSIDLFLLSNLCGLTTIYLLALTFQISRLFKMWHQFCNQLYDVN